MATSLQRVLVLTIGIYLMLVLASMLYHNTEFSTILGVFDTSSANLQNKSAEYYQGIRTTNPDTTTIQLDKSAGDQKYRGKTWIEVFLNPALGTVKPSPEADWLEQGLTKIINWIIHIIQLILGLEVFLILYSKKTT